jgi:HlyD family secretion protein
MSTVRPAIQDTSAQDVAIERGPGLLRRHRRIAMAVAAAVLLSLVVAVPAVSRWAAADRSVEGGTLRISQVSRGRFLSDVAVQGRVVAAVSPTLYATAAGTVSTRVAAGDSVAAGQVLAVLEAPELLSVYERERSTLQSLQAAYERQRIDARAQQASNRQTADLAMVRLNAARREAERLRTAFEQGVVSRQELDRREDEVAEAEVRHQHAVQDVAMQDEKLAFEVRTRQLDVDRQRVAVAELGRRVDELEVRSPVDGVVGSLAVQQRAAVTPNQPLMTVVDLSAFEIELDVPESYADDLELGMAAEITYGGAMYPGLLTAISPEVRNGQVSGRVRFAGTQPGDLRQNQRVSVHIVLEEKDDVLMVDRGAFFESGGGRIAYVVEDGIAHRTEIRAGAVSISKVEIASGLEEGQQVVISSIAPFEDAETVLIRK